jgi:putative membrane protein
MNLKILFASATLLAPSCDGNQSGKANADERALSAQSVQASPLHNLTTANAAPAPLIGSEYATAAVSTDVFEIRSARLALERSQNAAVRQLAQGILREHENSAAELRLAVTNLHSPVTVSAALNPDQQAKLNALGHLRGAAFDPVFLQQQVDVHQKALTLVIGYGENGDVAALKRHAQTMHDPVKNNLVRAQQLLEETK